MKREDVFPKEKKYTNLPIKDDFSIYGLGLSIQKMNTEVSISFYLSPCLVKPFAVDAYYKSITLNETTFIELLSVKDFILKNGVYFTTRQYKELVKLNNYCKSKVYPKQYKYTESRYDKIPLTYIMKDSSNGLYKIGKSINPKYREKTLQGEMPNVKIVKIFKNDIEKPLHKLYKNQRVRGEWFSLNEIQIRYICTHY
jgi:hypothetical protein